MTNIEDLKMEKMIEKKIQDFMSRKQFGFSKIQKHEHNGTDTIRVKEKDLLLNAKYNSFLICDTSETFTIINLPNISRVFFNGFAANNADGSPATKRAIINGHAEFGSCYGFFGTGSSISFDDSKIGVQLIQGSNSLYIDTSDLTKQRVGSTNQYFCYVPDDTGTIVVQVEITNPTASSFTMVVTLASNWKLQGSLIIS